MSHPTDTIIAVSSPPGIAPRGIIRLSGPQTHAILDRLVTRKPAAAMSSSLRRGLTRVTLHSPPIPAWCACFPAPHSYTGDDLAELQLPGNPALLERVLHDALAAGARLAEPGEFTFRAFLNHRLDLTQAEGVAATIAATSDAQLHAATMLREGQLGRLATDLADRLANALALVEAGIDFTDQEDVVPIGPAALDQVLAALIDDLTALLTRARPWKAIESLPWVVLVGAPSTGKSTLFNALLGRTRAVVSPTPGTTRDILAEPLALTTDDGRRIEVMLVDIAGLDTPTSVPHHAPSASVTDTTPKSNRGLESKRGLTPFPSGLKWGQTPFISDASPSQQAQAAARDAVARAELVLLMHADDDNRGFPGARGEDAALPQPRQIAAPIIDVHTKADLGIRDHAICDIAVSAVTGQGLDDLRRLIARHIGARGVSLAADLLALQPRHESALRSAAGHLQHARALLTPHITSPHLPGAEQIAATLRAALDALTSLAGYISPDDIIGRIFATFCVGK